MADQLALVLGAAGGMSPGSSEQALAVVQAVEALKAWADSVSVGATTAMVHEFEVDFADLKPETPSAHGSRRFLRHCRSVAAREIQVATGLPITACQRRVWFSACESDRVQPVVELMKLGRVTLSRAMALVEATSHLDGFTAAAIAKRVLRPLSGPNGVALPGAAPLSQSTFTSRLHKQLVLHHGLVGQAERTYQEALERRRLFGEPHPDGTGALVISGDGPRLAAAQARVDRVARRLRQGGDVRTIAQLRADVAIDLLLRGWIPNDPTFVALGKPPEAVVQLIVSLPTIAGLDHGVGQIPGWGYISSQRTRELALQLGSIWKRIVTDPLTGRAIEVSATTYRVPAGMAEQVKVRDGTCRGPGCEIPAVNCDLDHSTEWRRDGLGGATAETNLTGLHRGHHNLKTTGFWDSNQMPDGSLQWTTATGREFTTYPYIYEHPDNLPIKISSFEAQLGRRLAATVNPDIPLPGHFSIFEEMDWSQTLAPATPALPQHTWAVAATGRKERAAANAATAVADAATDGYPPPPF
ncbi:MAG: HNH endonuclease signature motif containing protein [Dermatophilaceae bacterium]